VRTTERIYYWTLLATAVGYVFWLLWRDETGQAHFLGSLALLALLAAAAFAWWDPQDEEARRARPLFFIGAAGFTLFALWPGLQELFGRVFNRYSFFWKLPGSGLVAETLYYAVPLALVLLLFRLYAPRDWRERFFLRLNWRVEDLVILAAFALIAAGAMWVYLQFVPLSEGWSPLGLKAGTLGFILFGTLSSAANAVVEEFWFRGAFLGLLARVMPPWPAIIIVSLMFGGIHYHGIPSGWLGVGLAAVYGLALTWWTWKRGSIWQAVALHFTTDVVIFFGVN